MQDRLIQKEGFSYAFNPHACSECSGNCCIGESGYIWVNNKEIDAIAQFLKLENHEFVSLYLKKVGYKYSIKEALVAGSYECLFFDKSKGCGIYNVRPKQCRTYPFWDYVQQNLQKELKACPGIVCL